jgi:tRNA (cmo5U34)-methyltransferase
VAQFHWDPESYLALIREEVPNYDRLQEEAAAAAETDAESVLDLGTGTGETARRVLEANPRARMVGVDDSREMLAALELCCHLIACGCLSAGLRTPCQRGRLIS